jgi:hypothetical protein
MGRSRRAKSTWIALREMRDPSLLVSLDYLALLAELKPKRFPAAAVRWHGRRYGSIASTFRLVSPIRGDMETSEREQIERCDGEGRSGPHPDRRERIEGLTEPDRSTVATDLSAALMERAHDTIASSSPSSLTRSAGHPNIDFLETVAKARRHLAARRAALPKHPGSD